jgi:hypothetical protein
MTTDNTPLPDGNGDKIVDPAKADKPPAKKAAAPRKTAAAAPRSAEVLKYAYTTDDNGNVTSLAAVGSTEALFEYVKSKPGVAFLFIDGPKGTDIIESINAL